LFGRIYWRPPDVSIFRKITHMKFTRISFICFFFASLNIQAQNPVIKTREYPKGYFRSPLSIPRQASGTFGELRATHFHAGDDYRTQQRVGLPLFAVAEG